MKRTRGNKEFPLFFELNSKNMSKKITNVVELRDSLLDVYNKIQDGKIGLREAKEHANIAGKILSSAKLQLEYNAYMKTQSVIAFLNV